MSDFLIRTEPGEIIYDFTDLTAARYAYGPPGSPGTPYVRRVSIALAAAGCDFCVPAVSVIHKLAGSPLDVDVVLRHDCASLPPGAVVMPGPPGRI